jgi:hypothetical protein
MDKYLMMKGVIDENCSFAQVTYLTFQISSLSIVSTSGFVKSLNIIICAHSKNI